MEDLNSTLMIGGKVYTAENIVSVKDIIPFPLKVVDMSTTVKVEAPEKHIGIKQQTPPEQIIAAMNETGIWNIVQFTQSDIEQKLRVAGRLIQDPKGFLDDPGKQFFDLSGPKAGKLKGVTQHRWAFRASFQKRYILKMISSYVFSVPGAKAVADSIQFVADELFTNAIYNAPFGDKDFTLDRSTMVFLDPHLSSEMIISHNEKYLFLGCVDQFGSFDCEEFIKSKTMNFNFDAKMVLDGDVGGAGLGMQRIIDLSPDIFVVVEKGKRTFVGCIFPLNMSLKKVRETSKNFFFISFENFKNELNSIIVERRGTAIQIRCMGDFDDELNFKELNLVDATSVAFDMMQLKKIGGAGFRKLIASIQGIKTLKSIAFENVPAEILPNVSSVVDANPNLMRIDSVCESRVCKVCQVAQNIVFKCETSAEKNSGSQRKPIECPACKKSP